MTRWTALVFGLASALACGTSRPAEPAAGQPATVAEAPEEGSPPRSGLIAVGSPAPEFSMVAHDGSQVSLSALRGSPVILYFYPKDETPG